MKQDVVVLDKNTMTLDKGSHMMEADCANVNEDLGTVQSVRENVDNLLRANNILIRGPKEYTEGKGLLGFLRVAFRGPFWFILNTHNFCFGCLQSWVP